MANQFQKTIWSAILNESFKGVSAYTAVTNKDYEGEARLGGTVKVNKIGAVTVSDYDAATGLGDPQNIASTAKDLAINQAKAFNIMVDDITAAQSNAGLIGAYAKEAVAAVSDPVEIFIAGQYVDVKAGNTIGTDVAPIEVAVADAYDYLVDLGSILSDNKAPKADRFVVVPSWYYGLLLKDSRFVNNTDALASGLVGRVNGMDVFESSNVPNTAGAKYKIMAGHRSAIAFAFGIEKLESYKPDKFFGDAVRGLFVYGAEVLKPEGIAILTASKKTA